MREANIERRELIIARHCEIVYVWQKLATNDENKPSSFQESFFKIELRGSRPPKRHGNKNYQTSP